MNKIFSYEKTVFHNVLLSSYFTKNQNMFWKTKKFIVNIDNFQIKKSRYFYLLFFTKKIGYISKNYKQKKIRISSITSAAKKIVVISKIAAEKILYKVLRKYAKLQWASPEKTYKITEKTIKLILKNCPLNKKTYCLQKTENTYIPEISLAFNFLLKNMCLGQKCFFCVTIK